MWLILACIVGGLILAVYLLLKRVGGDQEHWKKLGVPTIPNSATGTFLEKLRLPFHVIDVRAYNAIKKLGNGNSSDNNGQSVSVPTMQVSSSSPPRYGGMIELSTPIAFVLDPELIKHILVKDFDHFINRRGIALKMKDTDPFFHKMLFNMEDGPWKEMRATMSPTFSTGKIKRMFDIFDSSALKFVEFLKKSCDGSPEIDMRDSSARLTLDVISSAAFGIDAGTFNDTTTAFTEMATRFNNSSKFTATLMLKFIALMIVPKLLKVLNISLFDRQSVEFLADVVKKAILQRETVANEGVEGKRNDFLQLMLDARSGKLENEDGEGAGDSGEQKKAKLTEDLILAQCILFFIAGFDTTESLLIFAAYELALNPDVQENLRTEVTDAMENNGDKLSYDLVNKMPYLDMVISEALRKYPPVVRLDRRVSIPYKVPNSDVIWAKDTIAVLPVYALHYDPEIFPEPEKFLPERFTPEAKATRHAYTYMPFGLGPRACIANRFALVEAKAVIAHLVHSFKLEPSAKTEIPLTFAKSTSLKPANGIWLKLTPRNN